LFAKSNQIFSIIRGYVKTSWRVMKKALNCYVNVRMHMREEKFTEMFFSFQIDLVSNVKRNKE